MTCESWFLLGQCKERHALPKPRPELPGSIGRGPPGQEPYWTGRNGDMTWQMVCLFLTLNGWIAFLYHHTCNHHHHHHHHVFVLWSSASASAASLYESRLCTWAHYVVKSCWSSTLCEDVEFPIAQSSTAFQVLLTSTKPKQIPGSCCLWSSQSSTLPSNGFTVEFTNTDEGLQTIVLSLASSRLVAPCRHRTRVICIYIKS